MSSANDSFEQNTKPLEKSWSRSSGSHKEGANVNRADAALIGSGVGIIFHHSAGSNKGWHYNHCGSREMETYHLSCSAVQLEPVKRKWMLLQLFENIDPSPNNKNTIGRMKSDSTSNKNNISGEKPTLIQILYHLLPTEPKAYCSVWYPVSTFIKWDYKKHAK